MTYQEAILELAKHLMDCAMLMPTTWIESNGEGSKFMQAYDMVLKAMLEKQESEDKTE